MSEYDSLRAENFYSYIGFRIEHNPDAYEQNGYIMTFFDPEKHNDNNRPNPLRVSKETFVKFYRECQNHLMKIERGEDIFHVEFTTILYYQIIIFS
jgi:hypothetical protein